MNIYVGNLAREVTEEELRQEFAAFGQVASVSIIRDKYTGDSRGFAFVEMPVVSEGQAAINGLKGKTLQERTLDVNAARPRSDSGGRGGGHTVTGEVVEGSAAAAAADLAAAAEESSEDKRRY